MRLDSNYVRLHIVSELTNAPYATIRYDDFDVVVVDLPHQQAAAICLMERATELNEIIGVYREHEKAGIHTVFLLWCEMLLPEHNDIYEPPAWLRGLYALSGNKLYAYKTVGDEVDIFPVSFHPIGYGPERLVKHGPLIDIKDLDCARVDIQGAPLTGHWMTADFVPGRGAGRVYRARIEQDTYHAPPPSQPLPPELAAHYITLGLAHPTDWAAVKQAYRALARRYHPDLNPTHSTTAHMQAINAAYAYLLRYFDQEENA